MGAGHPCNQHPCARALGSRQEEAERLPSVRQPLKFAPVTPGRRQPTAWHPWVPPRPHPGPSSPAGLAGCPRPAPWAGRPAGRTLSGAGRGGSRGRAARLEGPLGAMAGRVLVCVSLLSLGLPLARGQRDFDLADALDGPDPTKKPGAGNYPDLQPYRPQPGIPDSGGDVYPRPKPPPARPQPGHPEGGGSGGHSNYGDQQGNTVAKVVSPIVSVVVVTLVGAAVSYYNRRRGCCVRGEPENV